MLKDSIRPGKALLQKASEVGLSELKLTGTQTVNVKPGDSQKRNQVMLLGKGSPEALKQLNSQVEEEEKPVIIDIDASPKVGQTFPDLEVYDLEESTTTLTLQDNKVYFIDIWATWCGPCQGPMTHNQTMLQNNPHWEGKAEIIAVSLDKDLSALKSRVPDFDKVTHFWAGQLGFNSETAKTLNVEGIPFCVLVNNKQLLWSGHPSDIDVEKSINQLVNGETPQLPPPPPKEGDLCPSLKVLETQTKNPVEIEFTDSKVYLLDFWATWCGPCQRPMQHNQDMLEKNPHWEGKAGILAISLDDSAEEVLKRFQEKQWDKIKNYWAGEQGFGAETPSVFGINGIPECFLVKEGKVLWSGHPNNRDLESDINALIRGEPLSDGPKCEVTEEQLNQKVAQAEEVLQEFQNEFPNLKIPGLRVSWTVTVKSNGDEFGALKCAVHGFYPQKYTEPVKSKVSKIKEIFENLEDCIEFQETQEIQRGETCSLCGKALGGQTQYSCLWCTHYHCEDCEKAPREGKGSHKLAHPHIVYQIHPEASNLDEIVFGKNEMPEPNPVLEEDPQDLTHQCVGCDNRHSEEGCQGAVVGTRWKCAHCEDYDYCQNCAEIWFSEPSQSMKSTAANMGHYLWHVMVKIPFSLY